MALKLQFFHRDDGSHVEVRSVLLKIFSYHLGALGGEKSVQKNTPNGNSWKLKACRLSEIWGKGAAREPEPKPSPPESAVPRTALAPAPAATPPPAPAPPAPPTPPASPAPPTPPAAMAPPTPPASAAPASQPQLLHRSLQFQARRLYLYRRWWQMEKGKWQKSLGQNNGNYSDPRVERRWNGTLPKRENWILMVENCRKFLLLQDGYRTSLWQSNIGMKHWILLSFLRGPELLLEL